MSRAVARHSRLLANALVPAGARGVAVAGGARAGVDAPRPLATIATTHTAAPVAATTSPSAPAAAAAPALGGAAGAFVDIPTTQIRRIIAQRLMESKWGSPHLYAESDADIDATLQLRKELKDKWQVAVSVNDFVIKAVAMALSEVTEANVHWDAKRAQLVSNSSIDISIAVATDKGLITPILKDADKKSLGAISKEVKQLAERARAGRLQPHEFQGGTFSISNLGMFAIDRFSAIINPPQSGILAVGRGEKVLRLPSESSADGLQLQPATKMEVTLSADARAIDANTAGKLLSAISANLSDPRRLLI
ncbi:hypothetical protein CLOM_g327 [Closterium sp. NIES-68]|nr:hypothetical protein CLOM_g327 [Closterium sp. NIES-68]GJP71909.1 hypothetical protein CLOP_g2700 [Closterium sp. NIES-67]GJP80166.1 hypothetical protein CLOP_g10391 [Closterium sp. NIES-67]